MGKTRMEQKRERLAKMERWGGGYERKRDGQREKMDRESVERASWREIERDVQGCGMFGGSSMDVCGGPVLQRGGALRRINGRGLWRGEAKGEEGESGPLWQGAISHLLTQAHSLTHIYTPTQQR